MTIRSGKGQVGKGTPRPSILATEFRAGKQRGSGVMENEIERDDLRVLDVTRERCGEVTN